MRSLRECDREEEGESARRRRKRRMVERVTSEPTALVDPGQLGLHAGKSARVHPRAERADVHASGRNRTHRETGTQRSRYTEETGTQRNRHTEKQANREKGI